MFQRIYYFWVLMVLLTLISSCKLAYIVVDIPIQPELPLPVHMKNVWLNNRLTDSLKIQQIKRNYMLKGNAKDEIISVAAVRVIKGLEEIIKEGDRFDFKGVYFKSTLTSGLDKLQDPIPEEEISKLCKEYGSVVLVSLESIDYSTSVSYKSFMASEPKDNNKIWTNTITYDSRKTEYFNGMMKVIITLGWRIYDSSTGKSIYQGYQTDSIKYEVQGKTKEEANKKLPSIINAVEKAGFVAGINVMKKVSPTYLTVERYYYKNVNQDFRKAYQLVKFRKWHDAANYWEPYLSDSNPKIKAMAAYNMALVAELDGNVKLAIKLINGAYELHSSNDILEYKEVLEFR
ncbi:MAG: hypothetical protein J7L04_13500 [Bacteroidales bacterium]|nr:hypothetical protein [Bacteroidales bacterium]